MIKIIRCFLLFLICFNFNVTYSQTVQNNSILFSDTTYECTIVTSVKKVYKDVEMFSLSDSTVKTVKDENVKTVTIEEISSIKFNARGFGKGALIGGGIGFVTGFLIGSDGGINLGSDGGSSEFSFGAGIGTGVIPAIPFGLIGGGLGALFASDQYFDLSNLDFKKKRSKILILMKEFS